MARKGDLGLHPPKVRLTVRVGITGHRNLSPRASAVLVDPIRSVLQAVHESATRASAQAAFAYEPGADCRLVSALAEGADRLAAKAAVSLELKVDSILPFEREVYEKTFRWPTQSVRDFEVFLPPGASALELDGGLDPKRSEAFGDLAEALIANCEVLLAVWRGDPAEGVGGTRDVMGRALSRGIPVVWLHPARPDSPCLIKSLEPETQVEVGDFALLLGCRIAERVIFDPLVRKEKFYLLDRILTWMGRSNSEYEKAEDFFSESSRCLPASYETDDEKNWRSMDGCLDSAESAIHAPIVQTFRQPFAWVDQLAKYYGRLHRGSLVLNYLLGATVVFLAFQGHMGSPHNPPAEETSNLWTWFELILIVLILLITLRGWVKRWHERWLDYRWLAEILRQMHFLAPQAWRRPPFRAPAHLATGHAGPSWLTVYSSNLLREAPLPAVKVDQGFLDYCRKTILAFVAGQIEYHKKREVSQSRIARRLHLICLGLFLLALLGCIFHLFQLFGLGPYATGLMVIVLPAFAGALSAILHHAEFEQQAEHSAALEKWLKEAHSTWEQGSTRRDLLEKNASALTEAMMDELVDWRDAFFDKPTPMGH